MMSANNFVQAFCLLVLGSLLSCNNDPCKDLECGLYGQCFTGTCKCDAGYVQNDLGFCETRTADLISGTYQALTDTNTCNIGEYFLNIDPDPVFGPKLLIANLGAYTCNSGGGELVVNAIFVEEDRFEIEAEERYCNQYTVFGSGQINADSTITLSYRAEFEIGGGSQTIHNCTVTLNPQ